MNILKNKILQDKLITMRNLYVFFLVAGLIFYYYDNLKNDVLEPSVTNKEEVISDKKNGEIVEPENLKDDSVQEITNNTETEIDTADGDESYLNEELNIIVDWNGDPIKLESDHIIDKHISGQPDNPMAKSPKKVTFDLYYLGDVSEGKYLGKRILALVYSHYFPSSWIRVIENDDLYIILDNYSCRPYEDFFNDKFSFVHTNNIFMSNLYDFEELRLNENVSLSTVGPENRFEVFSTLDKENLEKINFNEKIFYRSDGGFLGMNKDGSVQKYYLKLSFTDCLGSEEMSFCPLNIKLENNKNISGNYTMTPIFKECGINNNYWKYNYNKEITIDELKEIGRSIDGNIFYEPKDVSKYLNDNYGIDSYDGYEYPIVFWQDPFGDFIEMINMDLHYSIYSYC